MAESEISKDVNPYQGTSSDRWIYNQRYQELDAARELAKQTYRDSRILETECQQFTQRLEELAILESELLRHIAKQIKEHPENAPLVKDKLWIGIDVNNDKLTEDHQAEGSSGAESEVVSEGESMGKVERERAQLSDEGTDVAGIGLNLSRDGDADEANEKHKDKEELQEQGSTENMEVIEENGDSVTSLDKLQEELAQIQSLSAQEKAALEEKTRSLNVLLHEQQVLLHEIEEEEKAFDTLGLSETLRQTNALEREMQALSTDIDRLERLCEDPGDSDPSSVDEIDGEGSLNNQKKKLIAELTRLQREREKLEKEAQEKQAMLELVGELSQLRSVGNSAESNMRDMDETPSDLTAEHDVQGPHESSDSVVAKRLDFETIDFDQFGDQPPELPLNDDVDEELVKPELDKNGKDVDIAARESQRNKAEELQSQFEQTKEQEERTTHKFANLLNVDTKLEQAMKGGRDDAAEETSTEETEDKQRLVAWGSQEEKQLVGLLSKSDLGIENITPAGESIPTEDSITQSAEEPDLDHHQKPIASFPDTTENTIPPPIHDKILPPEEAEVSSSGDFDQKVEECLLGPYVQTEEKSPLQEVQLHEFTKGEDSLIERAADDLDPVPSSSEKDGSNMMQEPELQKSTVMDYGLEDVLETDRLTRSESGKGEEISPPEPEINQYRVVDNRVEELMAESGSSSASFAGKDENEVTEFRGSGDGDEPLQDNEDYDIAAEPGPLSMTDRDRNLEGTVPESAEANVSSFETAQNISMQEPDSSESNTEEDQSKTLSQKSVSSPLIDGQKKSGEPYSGSPSRRLKRKIERLQQPHLKEQNISTTPKKSKDLDKVTARQAKKLKELSEQLETLAKQLEEQTNLREELECRLEQLYKERQQTEAKLSSCSESLPVSVMPWSEETTEIAKLLEEQKELLATQVKEAERLRSAAEQKVGMLNDQVHDLEALTDIAQSMEDVFSIKDQVLRHILVTAFQALLLCFGLTIWLSRFADLMRNSLLPT